MSTFTPNYNLEKPDSTDDFKDFRASYNSNMNIIDQNMGGGGGSGGHTIIDPSGTSMPQEDDLQFTGKVTVTDDNVNQKTVVDVPAEIVELTQAQYEALPATKLTDGIAYFIKDVDNASVEGYPPLIYSLEEREVGVWTNGKPLYQKTFNLSTTFTITSTPQQLITITDIPFDTVLIVNANVYDSDDNRRYDIPNLTQATPDRIFAHMYLNKALNPCTFFVNVYSGGVNYAHCTDLNVTLQYTKTADTAGSGIWNGQGGLAHHYSTSEKIIGTWIDGKPLYEKVLVKNFDSSMSGTQYSWNHNISDIETCVSFQGYHVNDVGAIQGNRIEPVNISANTNFVGQNTIILYQFSSTQLRWAIGNTWVNPSYMPKALIAIVQYTKTTDV